jgi:uncharacterized protein DUF3168
VLYPLPPDPADALITFLKNDADVAAIAGDRVSTTKIDTSQPRIQLTMLPGGNTEAYEESTEFQVDCWGGTERQAKTLARTVCAAIFSMPMTSNTVTVAVPTLRPFDSPDPTTGRPRSICQVQITSSPEVTP